MYLHCSCWRLHPSYEVKAKWHFACAPALTPALSRTPSSRTIRSSFMTSTRTTKVVHCKRAPFDIYIGRPSKLGNLFVIGRDGNREQVIEKYRAYSRQSDAVGSSEIRVEREGPGGLVRATEMPWRGFGGTRRIVANSTCRRKWHWMRDPSMALLGWKFYGRTPARFPFPILLTHAETD